MNVELDVKSLSERAVFKTDYFEIIESKLDGDTPFFSISQPDSVIACVFDLYMNVVLVRQYRHNLAQYTLEFPAGGIDAGETAIQAVTREVREETGFQYRAAALGSKYRLMMNRTRSLEYLFVGMTVGEAQPGWKENGTEVIVMSRKDLKNKVVDGSFMQLAALGLLAVFEAQHEMNFWEATCAELQDKLALLLFEN